MRREHTSTRRNRLKRKTEDGGCSFFQAKSSVYVKRNISVNQYGKCSDANLDGLNHTHQQKLHQTAMRNEPKTQKSTSGFVWGEASTETVYKDSHKQKLKHAWAFTHI